MGSDESDVSRAWVICFPMCGSARPLRGRALPLCDPWAVMNLIAHFSEMARNNAWSNRRLHAACAGLTQAELEAPRTSFFPSLQATLNHILVVDWYYLDGLEGAGLGLATQVNPVPFPRLAQLAE